MNWHQRLKLMALEEDVMDHILDLGELLLISRQIFKEHHVTQTMFRGFYVSYGMNLSNDLIADITAWFWIPPTRPLIFHSPASGKALLSPITSPMNKSLKRCSKNFRVSTRARVLSEACPKPMKNLADTLTCKSGLLDTLKESTPYVRAKKSNAHAAMSLKVHADALLWSQSLRLSTLSEETLDSSRSSHSSHSSGAVIDEDDYVRRFS